MEPKNNTNNDSNEEIIDSDNSNVDNVKGGKTKVKEVIPDGYLSPDEVNNTIKSRLERNSKTVKSSVLGDVAAMFNVTPDELEAIAQEYLQSKTKMQDLESKYKELETNFESYKSEIANKEKQAKLSSIIGDKVHDTDMLMLVAQQKGISLDEVFTEDNTIDEDKVQEILGTIKETHNYLFKGDKGTKKLNGKSPNTPDIDDEEFNKQLQRKFR